MATSHPSRNQSPATVPIAPLSFTTPTTAKQVQSTQQFLSTPTVSSDHDNDNAPAAFGFPSTPVNMIMTPSIVNTPCITPIPDPCNSNDSSSLDEFDVMLSHEDFPKLLNIAAQVKGLQVNGNMAAQQQSNGRDGPLEATEVLLAVAKLQERLLSPTAARSQELSVEPRKILRGSYPMTDLLFDDSLAILQHELDRCQQQIALQSNEAAPPPKKKKKTTIKSNKEAIAIKYSKWQTDILMQWMIEHIDNPFPDQDEVHELMHQTNLTYSQVINWTTNVRKRNRKATCEEKKKPHHFIDFLFLAQKRDSVQEERSITPEPASRKIFDTPTTNAENSTPGTASRKNKRRADSSLPPLLSPASQLHTPQAVYGPSPTFYPQTPTTYFNSYPSGDMLAFPTSPAYYYPSYLVQGFPYNHGAIYEQQQQGQGYHPAPPRQVPPFRPYQRKPPSRPSTPSGSDPYLQPIKEEDEELQPSPVKVESSTERKSSVATTKVKEEPGNEDVSSAVQHKPDSAPSNGDVQVKQERVSPVTATSAQFHFEDGTAMDPIDLDAPVDNSLLHDFAMFWEFNLENDDEVGSKNDTEGHAMYVLRPEQTESSQDVPALMEEKSRNESSAATDMKADDVPSDAMVGV
ncbi:Homeobox protein PKNOX1 [Seminavis robusta]|uniref:Homeobox protein PKNOX1 n=1 Tax=Seminavis robusta TaxID=568900 RepID=A0A9N8EPX3_9STRA|nr:Homeobox protein PKNOX1 [Seminavis robusta]|eukprot:Sro1315_g262020.1 Homeobox protein PKNOX1 (630) ;mRNA; r:4338-6227